jgi:hypothetical protein
MTGRRGGGISGGFYPMEASLARFLENPCGKNRGKEDAVR